MHPKHKGTMAETKVVADLYAKGYSVAIVVDDLLPFDLFAIDDKLNAYKVQVKYCKKSDETAVLPVRNCMSNKSLSYTKTYTRNEVDIFAMYIPKSTIAHVYPPDRPTNLVVPQHLSNTTWYSYTYQLKTCENGQSTINPACICSVHKTKHAQMGLLFFSACPTVLFLLSVLPCEILKDKCAILLCQYVYLGDYIYSFGLSLLLGTSHGLWLACPCQLSQLLP